MTRLLYQEDAYLTSARAEVVRCEAKGKRHEVVLSETVLYPEGGGQPSDAGTVGGCAVLGLAKRADGVVHLLEEPVEGTVEVELDWEKRYDHMQQHTAQHLITAVAADRFGLPTTAFHLGEERSDVELDGDTLPEETLLGIEEKVNELVRAGLPVTGRFVDPKGLTEDVRSRGLPEDLTGPVRLVEVEGVDRCTCGGTHVANTAQLQTVKLLHTEGMRGGTRLFFIAGRRSTQALERMLDRERALTRLLSCGPGEHARNVEKLKGSIREVRRLRKELAGYIGERLCREQKAASHHAEDGDMDFLRTVAAAVKAKRPELIVLLTAGEVFLLAGPDDDVATLGPAVADVLGGRGGGKGGLFQGKFSRTDRLMEAEELLLRA